MNEESAVHAAKENVEDELLFEDLGEQKEKKGGSDDRPPRRRLRDPRRRRQYLAELCALIAVIALSGLIMLSLFMQRSYRSLDEQNEKAQALNDRLVQIQTYIDSMDASIRGNAEGTGDGKSGAVKDGLYQGKASAENLAASAKEREDIYKELSDTVSGLEENLKEYRDMNDLKDGDIEGSLDGVISSLARIQKDMEESQQSQAQNKEQIGLRLDAIDQEDKKADQDILRQVKETEQSIQNLLDKTADESSGRYIKLQSLLQSTSNDLDGVVRARFDDNGDLIRDVEKRLDSASAERANALANVIKENRTAIDSTGAIAADARDAIRSTGEEVAGSRKVLDETKSALDATGKTVSDVSSALGDAKSGIEGSRHDIAALRDNMEGLNDEQKKLMKERLDRLQDKLGTVETSVARLEELSAQLDTLQASLSAAQKSSSSQISALQADIAAAQEKNNAMSADIASLLAAMTPSTESSTQSGSAIDKINGIVRELSPSSGQENPEGTALDKLNSLLALQKSLEEQIQTQNEAIAQIKEGMDRLAQSGESAEEEQEPAPIPEDDA